MDRFDYSVIPSYTMESLKKYIERGTPTGHFLLGVLTNDLSMAVSNADEINRHAIVQIVCWLHNEAPGSCYGSKEKVQAWVKEKRLRADAADVKSRILSALND